jgi:hypothetical protein
MRKNILRIQSDFEFDILGISTGLPDFQLAWHINSEINVHLKRVGDHQIAFRDNKFLRTSLFQYTTDNLSVVMIRNKVNESESFAFVVPEAKNIDYFLIIQDDTGDLEIVNVKNTLSKIKNVILVQKMDVQKLKSIDNLIID